MTTSRLHHLSSSQHKTLCIVCLLSHLIAKTRPTALFYRGNKGQTTKNMTWWIFGLNVENFSWHTCSKTGITEKKFDLTEHLSTLDFNSDIQQELNGWDIMKWYRNFTLTQKASEPQKEQIYSCWLMVFSSSIPEVFIGKHDLFN